MESIQVKVRDAAGTYTARAKGKSASATAGREFAVRRLAQKFGIQNATITEIDSENWQITQVEGNH